MPISSPVDLTKVINYAALKDRNVLITGGASGLGKAFTYMFAAHGANIVIADVQDSLGIEVEKDLAGKHARVKFVHVDVSSFESQVHLLQQSLDFFPRHEVDIFVPCAGILQAPTQINPQDPVGLKDLRVPPPDLSTSILKVNLSGVFVGVMLVARYGMGLHRVDEVSPRLSKTIVLIASLAGYCGAEGSVEYTASKFGVRGILRGLRKQLESLGVRLNAVSPFYVETPMTALTAPALKHAGIPLAPLDYVVEAAARLATDESAWGRSVFVMPEGLSDGGDDSAGGQGGKAFSVEALGKQWDLFVNGPLSDNLVLNH